MKKLILVLMLIAISSVVMSSPITKIGVLCKKEHRQYKKTNWNKPYFARKHSHKRNRR